jgi:hypothetical protein
MSENASQPASTPAPAVNQNRAHAAWFRIAAGFALLAAFEMASTAWATFRTAPVGAEVARPQLAPFFALSALLLITAAVLAVRQEEKAGLAIILGYAIAAMALYVSVGVLAGPSAFMLVAMVALAFPVFRRRRPKRAR